MNKRILIVDDDASLRALLQADLGDAGFDIVTSAAAVDALELVATDDFAAVVTDLNLKGMSGVELCERIVKSRPGLPVVVITGFGSIPTAVAAMKAGAYDFVTKPFESEVLVMALQRATSHRNLGEEVKRLRKAVADAEGFGEMLGTSPAMRELYKTLHKVSGSDASILIYGETGTGKELVARGLHAQSPRRDGPFVALNCAAIPGQLIESELFGHARGAFTDAKTGHTGLFQQASGGTLFLDEIGEMPLELQPKLLRALQERVIRPIGGSANVDVDVRVIAATNRDLEARAERGEFRRDLLYRINVLEIALPPLRMRGNDVLVLAQHFIERSRRRQQRNVSGLTSAAADKILSYEWPGNVRELENAIERAVTLAEHDKIIVDDLPERVRNSRASQIVVDAGDPGGLVSLDEVERRYVTRVYEAVAGNKAQAARVLGVDRKTLYRKLEKYGLADGENVHTSDDD